MIMFLILGAALLVFAMALLFLGVRRTRLEMHTDLEGEDQRKRVEVFRDRKAEIAAELASGRITVIEASAAELNLSEQLQREATDLLGNDQLKSKQLFSSASKLTPLSKGWLFVSGLLIVAVALGAYSYLGAPELTELSFREGFEKTAKNESAPSSPGDLAKTIEDLKKLAIDKPKDASIWGSLGRAYRMSQQLPDSVNAYKKAQELGLNSPDFLVDYAEAIAASKQGDFSGEPIAMLTKALELQPNLPKGVALMGAAQFRLGNLVEAKKYLELTLQALPPGSEQAKAVQSALDQVNGKPSSNQSSDFAFSVNGTIRVSPQLLTILEKMPPEASLFLALRGADRPMPIAAKKLPVIAALASLKTSKGLEFTLGPDDLLPGGAVMPPAALLLVARVSASGSANRASGDLSSSNKELSLTKEKSTVMLDILIDQINP